MSRHEPWTLKDIAEGLRVSRSTAYAWSMRDGFPPSRKTGAGRVWDAQDVRRWRAKEVRRKREARKF